MSPLLERKVLATVCETGSFEKASRVCGEWGCALSDDKAMDTARRVGDACLDSDLPELCANAAHDHRQARRHSATREAPPG